MSFIGRQHFWLKVRNKCALFKHCFTFYLFLHTYGCLTILTGQHTSITITTCKYFHLPEAKYYLDLGGNNLYLGKIKSNKKSSKLIKCMTSL